jgi:hypothetical protein
MRAAQVPPRTEPITSRIQQLYCWLAKKNPTPGRDRSCVPGAYASTKAERMDAETFGRVLRTEWADPKGTAQALILWDQEP